MLDFWTNFLANLAADALIGVAIYYAITRQDERRKARQSVRQGLGLLKRDAQINAQRAREYIELLGAPDYGIDKAFPMRYTRGSWNALKESGLLANIADPYLVYKLFRMNEAALIANRNLRRLQLALLEGTGGNRDLLAATASRDSEQLIQAIEQVLTGLGDIEVPEIETVTPTDESE